MSNYVDVLAVMDRNILFAERTGSAEDLENAREARAAVAELIGVCQKIEAYRAVGAAPLRVPTSTWEQWRDSLARVTGGAV